MNDIFSVLDQQVHRLDLLQLSAMGLILAVVGIMLLIAILITVARCLKHFRLLRDELDLRNIRQYQALETLLQQAREEVAELSRIRQAIGSYSTQRESQIEERKQILKSIAGHFSSAAR